MLLSEALLQVAEEPGKPTTTPNELLLPSNGSRQPLFSLNKPLLVAAMPEAAAAAAAAGVGSSASPRSQLNSKLVQLLLPLLLLPKQASKSSPS
jgi:hypothetical protein